LRSLYISQQKIIILLIVLNVRLSGFNEGDGRKEKTHRSDRIPKISWITYHLGVEMNKCVAIQNIWNILILA